MLLLRVNSYGEITFSVILLSLYFRRIHLIEKLSSKQKYEPQAIRLYRVMHHEPELTGSAKYSPVPIAMGNVIYLLDSRLLQEFCGSIVVCDNSFQTKVTWLLPTSQPSEDARLARRQRIVPREEWHMRKNSRTSSEKCNCKV